MPTNTPYGYAFFPCAAWLDAAGRLTQGFHGQGVYSCVNTQTLIDPRELLGGRVEHLYVDVRRRRPAGLSGAFSWRVVLEGTCDVIDTVPDRHGAARQRTAC